METADTSTATLSRTETAPVRAQWQSEMVKGFLVSQVSLLIPDLAEELEGLRLLQLSDFHFGPATSKDHLERAIRIAAPLSADILLLTGDYLQLSTVGLRHVLSPIHRQSHYYTAANHRASVRIHISQLREMLSIIKAPLGRFAVLGNHDYSEGARIITSRLGDDIVWLRNSSHAVQVGSAALHIAGVDDVRYGAPDLQRTQLELAKARLNAPGPSILLSHNPDIVLDRASKEMTTLNLIVSGHTHGGQIRLPKIGALMTQTKQRAHVQGLSHFNTVPLYVSNGIGFGGVRVRLNCPPEIVLFELSRSGKASGGSARNSAKKRVRVRKR